MYDSDCKGMAQNCRAGIQEHIRRVKGHVAWISGERAVQPQRTANTEVRGEEHAQGIRELELHGCPGLCPWLPVKPEALHHGLKQKSCNDLGIGFYLVTSSYCVFGLVLAMAKYLTKVI